LRNKKNTTLSEQFQNSIK